MSNIDDAFIASTFPNIAGDHSDDDAQYVDELYRVNPDGVPTAELPQGHPVANFASPPKGKNRLLGFTKTLPRAGGPYLVFPADSNRSQLLLYLTDDSGYLSDNKDLLSSDAGRQQCFLVESFTPWDIANYTGAVWIASESSDAGNITIAALSVTE